MAPPVVVGVGLAGAGAGALGVAVRSEDLKRLTRSSSTAMWSFSVSA